MERTNCNESSLIYFQQKLREFLCRLFHEMQRPGVSKLLRGFVYTLIYSRIKNQKHRLHTTVLYLKLFSNPRFAARLCRSSHL